MAVWLALSQCRNVSVYGFGSCQSKSRKDAALINGVYYDVHDRRQKKGFAAFHNFQAEWRWLQRLHREERLKRVC